MTAILDGKVVLVTGGTGALGAAVVDELATSGARVVVVDRHSREGDERVAVSGLQADLAREEEAARVVAEIVASHGRLDGVVNVVGGFAMGDPVATMATEVWRRMMALNLDIAFFVSRAALAPMLRQRSGSIVHIGSRSALEPQPRATAYAVSKSAVVALVRNLSEEVRLDGVRVNAILPSIIDTPVNRKDMPTADFDRWPKPAELGKVIRFLISDESAVISGAAIPVYGRS